MTAVSSSAIQTARADAGRPALQFRSKAETLAALAQFATSFTIPPSHHFTVESWRGDPAAVLAALMRRFADTDLLVVRSSALSEDQSYSSMAGAYESRLNVQRQDTATLRQAIDDVIASYGAGSGQDLVLVQPMIRAVDVSGVITTRNIADGGPYYVLNYDDVSGRTDTVTGGTGVHKTVLIHRSAAPDDGTSPRVRKMLSLARELEQICGDTPLDIEFGIDRAGVVYVLQVRPIASARHWSEATHRDLDETLARIDAVVASHILPQAGLAGRKTTLGTMPDWNPAEILGAAPRPLAVSLYEQLITDSTWREARRAMGYRDLPGQKLLVRLAGIPYIDVRASLNSLLPAGLSATVADRLVTGWIDYLDRHPELHDKVEFDVAQTALDFSFDTSLNQRLPGLLSTGERDEFRAALRRLTASCLDLGTQASFRTAEAMIVRLQDHQHHDDLRARARGADGLRSAAALLDRCRRLGTFAFSVLARHAFIAEALLRTACQRGALTAERIQEFKLSIATVMGRFTEDLGRVAAGTLSAADFMDEFGHLRPGTYDICSPPYRDRPEILGAPPSPHASAQHSFALVTHERDAVVALLREVGLADISAETLFEYARRAIAGREHAKFVFTRDLSNALEGLKSWGAHVGLSAEDLSYIEYGALANELSGPPSLARLRDGAVSGKAAHALSKSVKLSYLIRDARDIRIVPIHRSAPNFVTTKRVEGNLILLTAESPADIDLAGKIVCIESADPGFDWIFSRDISGLITKYGGTNSHMAIRAAEIGLPAAIGCGELNFAEAQKSRSVELCCAERILRFMSYDV